MMVDPSTITFLAGLAVNFIAIWSFFEAHRREREKDKLALEKRLVTIETHLIHVLRVNGFKTEIESEAMK